MNEIEKIRTLFKDLKLSNTSKIFEQKVKLMLNEMILLKENESNESKKNKYAVHINHLKYTVDKEVASIKFKENIFLNKNTVKNRAEFINAIDKAYNQVYQDIFLLID